MLRGRDEVPFIAHRTQHHTQLLLMPSDARTETPCMINTKEALHARWLPLVTGHTY
jgi:hypothetical protein